MLKQIEAGALSVGYEEHGPPAGMPVVLLHGSARPPGSAYRCAKVAVKRGEFDLP